MLQAQFSQGAQCQRECQSFGTLAGGMKSLNTANVLEREGASRGSFFRVSQVRTTLPLGRFT